MAIVRQSLLLFRLSLSTLHQRLATSLTIVIAMACVVGVLTSMLSVTSGIVREYRDAGDPDVAIVMPAQEMSDDGSGITRGIIGTVLNAPGIARGADGKVMADPELIVWVPPIRHVASGGELRIRGIGAAGVALRPQFRLVSGRMFQPGREELIAGVGVQHGFGLGVGDRVIMRDGAWPIVGTFSAGGVLQSELMGDGDTIATMTRRSGFGGVEVRLENPAKFGEFKQWLTTNPALAVSAESQLHYYARIAADQSGYFTAMAYLAGGLMSVGALFGAVNMLYGVVNARRREMATLRAIGYRGVAVAASVVFEALVLSLAGAAIGAGIAWMLFNGHQIMSSENVYSLFVSPQLVASGIAWALILALLGSLLPAARAARLQIVEALRAA